MNYADVKSAKFRVNAVIKNYEEYAFQDNM